MPQPTSLPDQLSDGVPLEDFLDSVAATVAPLEFRPERTLAAVSICRDELTQHLFTDVERRWGPTFSLGGLGGLPSLGSTGWGACLSHVPDTEGRGKLLVLGFPHLGVGPAGTLGRSPRRHQHDPTPTCGALDSILTTWTRSETPRGPLSDHEAELLRELLAAELDSDPSDILAITRAAAAAVLHETRRQLEALAPWDRMDVAVFTGIQVHLPGASDHVIPMSAEHRGADGVPVELQLR